MDMNGNTGVGHLCRQILAAVSEAVVCLDLEGRCCYVNNGCLAILGYTDESAFLGKRLHDIVVCAGNAAEEKSGAECRVLAAVLRGDIYSNSAEQLIRSDGVIVHASYRAEPVYGEDRALAGAVVTFHDTTQLRTIEAQLLKAQKMEAIGTLAGGVAHDFNNVLTAIIGFGTLMEMKMASDDPMMRSLQQILAAADRAADLTRSILAFSRKQFTDMHSTGMNRIVAGIEKMMRRLVRENILLTVTLCEEDTPIMADPGQIEQVLLNLVTNAVEAMPKGGAIHVSTALCELDDTFTERSALPGAGTYVLLKFSDNGCGMDEATAAHLFDPLFTTKTECEGTGLGLPVSYGIIRRHNGYIECQTGEGKGTEFRIYLPVMTGELSKQSEGTTSMAHLKGRETLLLAEDDHGVRALNKRMFEQFGYTVIEAADGEEALDRFQQYAGRIDLVILDVIMPRKSAVEVYRMIQTMETATPFLFISGYSEDFLRKQSLPEEVRLIKKPVPPAQYLEIVRDELDRRSIRKIN